MAVPLAVVAIVIALIMPMPSMLLDFLIVVDITLSVIVLLVSVYIRKAGGFQRISHHAAVADDVPAGSEHLLGAPDPAERQHRESRPRGM